MIGETHPNTRRSLLLHAPGDLRWSDEALPPAGPDEIAVRTIAGAISIGTELPLYMGSHRGSAPVSYPRMTGYESLGVVTAVGERVREIAVGSRVVAFYGHRTGAVLPADRAVPVPPDIGDAEALLLILACDTAKGVAKLAPQPGEEVLISGAGAIGLLTLFNLRARGIANVDVIEPLRGRRALALAFGARGALSPEEGALPERGDGYAAGFECAGRDAAFAALQRALVRGGRLCVLSDGNLEPLTLDPAFHEKELSVVSSSDGLDYREYAAWYWGQARAGVAPLARLFEREIGAEQLPAAFADLARGARPVKILVRY